MVLSINKNILDKSKHSVIEGTTNVEIGIVQVDTFDKMDGVSYIDDDTTGLVINVLSNNVNDETTTYKDNDSVSDKIMRVQSK